MVLSLENRSGRLLVVAGLAAMLMLSAWASPVPPDGPATAASMKTPPADCRITVWWVWYGHGRGRRNIRASTTACCAELTAIPLSCRRMYRQGRRQGA
jgi:hypothetical protein